MMARMPLVYLVDSAGVFLPLQEDVFQTPTTSAASSTNNADVISTPMGIPRLSAIMGFCVAGGAASPSSAAPCA
ncbi:MAG: carboxyl transferase domain-containing protein [Phycisphaerales bacterium]